MEIMLYAIIVAAIIAIIIAVSKRKKKRDTIEGTGKEVVGMMDDSEYNGPPVNVIYACTNKPAYTICPFCDGENDINAVSCAICGGKFDSRKR